MIGCLFVLTLSAQILTVKIVDTNGHPIPNATFYIRETAHGIMADERGEFRTELDAGEYTCEISSLGYERKLMTVSVPPEGSALNIELTEKTYTLREVTVIPGKEDPAYRIMRNVIARAPYHLHQVKSYESGVYLKGSFKVEKMPALVKSQIKDPNIKSLIGKLLVYESQNEVKYNEPDKYEQRVIAVSTSIPESFNIDDNLPLSAITRNIYSPATFGGLLAPGSFSVYKFKLEDTYKEEDHLINKIRVIPRKKSGLLVNGWLYIVDDTWTVQQASLSLTQTGTTVRFNLTYHEVKPGAFLPSAYDMSLDLSLMGIKGGGQFYASIKYNKLETNDNYVLTKADTAAVIKPVISGRKTLTKQQQKNLQKIEELAGKEKLTTREAYKMAQLVEKTVESDEVKEQKRQLERRPLDSMIIVTRDSLALKRDSSFWNKTRILPLREEELRSYLQRDSLKVVTDSLKSVDSLKNRTFGKWMTNFLLGEKTNLGNNYYFRYDGLLRACQEYNFVDGFRIGQYLEAGVNFDRNRSLSIAPAIYYTTARKEIDITIDGTLSYAPLRNGKLVLSTGNTITDYAEKNGTGRFGNAVASLFFADNTAMFYQKKYAAISNKIDIANGLALTAGFNYEKRNDLTNNTSYSFFGGRPAPNLPHGQTGMMPDHKAYIANITLEYTPRYHYSIWRGQKIYRNSSYPTIRMSYKKAFSGGSKVNSSYDNIEASVFQNIQLSLFNRLSYEINAGIFPSSGQTYLPDFKHFQTNELFMTGKLLENSFTMDNYRYATDDKWLQAHVSYASNFLLLKQIPFMQGLLFDEAIHAKTLWTPDLNHNEIGYSIGFGELIRVGVFAGFKELQYESTGIVVSLPIILNMFTR
jgi:hypothetical protein